MSQKGASVEGAAGGGDGWVWRERLRSNPATARLYRVSVAVVGLVVVVAGIVMLPFPGPGWLVIFLGLGIWASEFEWAQRLLAHVRDLVEGWWAWLDAKGWWAQALAALATGVVILAVFWAMFACTGVPAWLPDVIGERLRQVPGLG